MIECDSISYGSLSVSCIVVHVVFKKLIWLFTYSLFVQYHLLIPNNVTPSKTFTIHICIYLTLKFLLYREVNILLTQVSTIFLLIVQLLWMCRQY